MSIGSFIKKHVQTVIQKTEDNLSHGSHIAGASVPNAPFLGAQIELGQAIQSTTLSEIGLDSTSKAYDSAFHSAEDTADAAFVAAQKVAATVGVPGARIALDLGDLLHNATTTTVAPVAPSAFNPEIDNGENVWLGDSVVGTTDGNFLAHDSEGHILGKVKRGEDGKFRISSLPVFVKPWWSFLE